MTELDLQLPALRARYADGSLTPVQVAEEVLRRILARGDDGVWIAVSDRLTADAEALDPADAERLPLWGVPFAVKDNIDVLGLPTTAACPSFAHWPTVSAEVVSRLVAAGALVVGKTNLDQFATGLNGTRSPHGVPGSAGDPTLISGGSSSGSAVAVALAEVTFALATDTAGSGRVPAALNGIVGLKPSRGRVSARGLVPACRSLDCISIMATTVADATAAHAVAAGFDVEDAWSRRWPAPAAAPRPMLLDGIRLAVPEAIAGWGERGEREVWETLLGGLRAQGAVVVPVDVDPLLEAGRQLYGGPWLAERAQAIEESLEGKTDGLLPVLRDILAGAEAVSGADVFAGEQRMRELCRAAERLLGEVDALLVPTVTTTFTIEEMRAEPIARNAALGTFTTFTNLLDLCAVAVPAGITRAGTPFGVTVQGLAGDDDRIASLAAAVSAAARVDAWLDLAVVGAHLEGMPLHGEVLSRGAVLRAKTTTEASYRLYALPGGPPLRPGLARVAGGGEAIEVEVYRFPRYAVGGFLATVPPPLAIGTVALAGGEFVHGFVCEPIGLDGAVDITAYGGWRAYLSATAGSH